MGAEVPGAAEGAAFTTLFELGPPPWSELAGHPCLKYATWAAVRRTCIPWVRDAVQAMSATLPVGQVLIDVRYWPHLDVGQIPGVPGWHYDCHNRAGASADEHRLYFSGAGCRTRFRPDVQPPENWVVAYSHDAEHEITPAMLSGPRLLIRCSRTDLTPDNRVYTDAYIAPHYAS